MGKFEKIRAAHRKRDNAVNKFERLYSNAIEALRWWEWTNKIVEPMVRLSLKELQRPLSFREWLSFCPWKWLRFPDEGISQRDSAIEHISHGLDKWLILQELGEPNGEPGKPIDHEAIADKLLIDRQRAQKILIEIADEQKRRMGL